VKRGSLLKIIIVAKAEEARGKEVPLSKTFRDLVLLTITLGLVIIHNKGGLAEVAMEPKTFTWDKKQTFMISRALQGGSDPSQFMKSECVSAIIGRLHSIVSWSKVKKSATREKIWVLYTRGNTVDFKLKGFSIEKLKRSKTKIKATCNFEAVTPLIDVSEEAILNATGLTKYFSLQRK
jgi:hypothetical protein